MVAVNFKTKYKHAAIFAANKIAQATKQKEDDSSHIQSSIDSPAFDSQATMLQSKSTEIVNTFLVYRRNHLYLVTTDYGSEEDRNT